MARKKRKKFRKKIRKKLKKLKRKKSKKKTKKIKKTKTSTSTSNELIFKVPKKWSNNAYVNKIEYEKKYDILCYLKKDKRAIIKHYNVDKENIT